MKKLIILFLLCLIALSSRSQIYILNQDGDSVKIEFTMDTLYRDGGEGTVKWTFSYGKYDTLKPPLIVAPKFLHDYNYSFDYSGLEFEGRQPAIIDTTTGTFYVKDRYFKDEVTEKHPNYVIKGTYMTIPIIDIKTKKKVIIENCVFVGAGDFIHARFPNADVTVRNCVFVGLPPTIKDFPRGKAVYIALGKYVDIQNNYLEQVRGFYVEESRYDRINIRANKAKNIDGRFSNQGSRGRARDNTYLLRAPAYFIKLSLVSMISAIIQYNEVINYPNESAIEDFILISKNNADGYGDEYPNLNVEYNFFYGNWSYPFADRNENYHGAVVRVTGAGTSAQIRVTENSAISGKDFRIEAGNNNEFRKNVKMFSHKHPDGSPYLPEIFTFNVLDPANTNSMSNSRIEENSIAQLTRIKVSDREDGQVWDNVDINTTSSYSGNREAENTTLADEQDEYSRWRYIATERGINIGPFKMIE